MSPADFMSAGMSKEHAEMVADGLAEIERKMDYGEQEHERINRYPKGRYSSSRLIPTKFLHSALFRVADKRVPREVYAVEFLPLTSGGYIEFSGEELRQDDETVLLELTYRMSGCGRVYELKFDPKEFVRAIGWGDGHIVTNDKGERAPYSVYRLKACIERLRGTDLRLFDKYYELRWSTGLVQEAVYLEQWSVLMSGRLLDMLVESATALNARIRKQLHEGLETWLYGHLCANDCSRWFRSRVLLEACGSKATLPEFGRALREALVRIKDVGGLIDFTPARGKLFVFKK